MSAPADRDERGLADRWLAAELDRTWLIAERALRAYQTAQVRPQPNHPSVAEIEAMLTARRAARRRTPEAPVEDDAQLSAAIDDAEATLAPLRRAAPIGRIVAHLGLRPLEIETLVTAMAPHVDAPIADIFALLRGPGGGRRGVDLALVAQLYRLRRGDRVGLLDALDPDRPLLAWRLLQIAGADSAEAYGSMSHRALRPTFDLLSALLGRGDLAPELSRCAAIRRDPATLDDLRFDPRTRADVQAICDAARSDQSGGDVPWLVLWGPAGIGKRTVAARYAAFAGRPLVSFDPSASDRGSFDDLFGRVQREALIRGAFLYIGPLPPELQAGAGRELTRRLRGFHLPVVIGVDGLEAPRIVSDHPRWEVGLAPPSEPVRAQLWRDALVASRGGAEVDAAQLARAFNLTPGEIGHAVGEAAALARRDQGRAISHADVRAGVERRLRNDLGELATRLDVSATWDDLVLPADDMDRIDELISRKKFADVVYNQWGYGKRVGYGKGLIALFSGPPGTGKTMLAGLIAGALDLDLYQVDLAQVVSKWVGETEKHLGRVFDQAERAHAVLLFDEADSLFAKRTEVKSSNDRYANMATNYLLQRLERYQGIAVLTSNKEAALDEALQRRLTLHLRLEIPGIPERARLWQSLLPAQAPVRDDVDLTTLAREFELSGGYIKNAAVRAAFLAASHGAGIDMEILRLASALELEDMGRVVMQRGGLPVAASPQN